MSDPYPRSFPNIPVWATTTGTPIQDARTRFVQFVILCGIASEPSLRNNLVFKGGNALDFVLQPNRSTIDLDFSLDMEGNIALADTAVLQSAIARGLARSAPRHGMMLTVHSIRRKPPGGGRNYVTIEARVGYGLPDEQRLLVRMANGQANPNVIPVEDSLNEPIHGSSLVRIDETVARIRISTMEDIVVEKLRALLQQSIRNRHRRQDILDLAVILRFHPDIDPGTIAQALLLKADARAVPVSRTAFRNPDLAARARIGYDELETTTRILFVPFEEALAAILVFVESLPIPEG